MVNIIIYLVAIYFRKDIMACGYYGKKRLGLPFTHKKLIYKVNYYKFDF